MVMDEDRIALAKVETTLVGVVTTLGELRDEIRSQRGETVTRNEWTQRNTHVDAKFDHQAEDISEIKQDLASKRAPWWSVAAVVIAGLALLYTILASVNQA